MLKFWILALAAIPLVAWLFNRVPQQIVPKMVTDGTEQVLVQWRDALQAYHKDVGKFPEQLENMNGGQSLMASLTSVNPGKKQYLDPGAVILFHTVPVDGWQRELRFDPEQNGNMAHIISDGPDGIANTADDIDSRNLQQRNLPVPPDPAEEGKPKAKQKPAATTAPVEEPQP